MNTQGGPNAGIAVILSRSETWLPSLAERRFAGRGAFSYLWLIKHCCFHFGYIKSTTDCRDAQWFGFLKWWPHWLIFVCLLKTWDLRRSLVSANKQRRKIYQNEWFCVCVCFKYYFQKDTCIWTTPFAFNFPFYLNRARVCERIGFWTLLWKEENL